MPRLAKPTTALLVAAVLLGVDGGRVGSDHESTDCVHERSRWQQRGVRREFGRGTPTNLTSNPASDHSPTWSPDGSSIAFISDQSGNPDIWAMNADGSNPANLTNSIVHESDPVWSPDGSRIAYGAESGIFVIAIATGRITRLTDANPVPIRLEFEQISQERPPQFQGADQPAWSPDGSIIAFARRWWIPATPRSFVTFIFTVPGGGGTSSFLARGGYAIGGLDWASDGLSIVWSDVPFQTGARLQRLDVGTGTSTDITVPLASSHYTDPDLSSDGAQLAFSAHTVNLAFADTYAWPMDGSAPPRRLTTDPAWDTEPAWQPWFPPVGMVDTTTGAWTLREGAAKASFYYGDAGDYPFVGDWDCDGDETPGMYSRVDGYVYLRNANTTGNADLRFFFGNPADVPLVGDFDGDGCDTVSIYRPDEQRFYVVNTLGRDGGGLGPADFSFVFGNPGDKPVVGDWDGDGVDEVGLYRESTGLFYWRNTLTTGNADGQIYFGNPGDVFVAGDWDEGGGDTPAVLRPNSHVIYFRLSLTEGVADFQFHCVSWGCGSQSLLVAGEFGLAQTSAPVAKFTRSPLETTPPRGEFGLAP